MAEVKKIAHIAIVVDELEKSLVFWRDALGMQVSHIEEAPAEQSKVVFMQVGESQFELVKPLSEQSGIARYMAKRGPGMHHVCLEVDDIVGMLAQLKAMQITLINEIPAESSDGKKYAFIHPKSTNGVLVELYELPE